MRPAISVIMSVYNGGEFLRDSIESILDQTFPDFEFIIIDDGSNDGSSSILKDYASIDRRISLLENSNNIGLTKSLNRGLSTAKGDFIARQDADDQSLPHRFETQLSVFESHPNIGLVSSSFWVMDKKGDVQKTVRQPVDDTAIRWRMLFGNAISHASVMIRHSLLTKFGLRYDEKMVYAQDYELWSRILDHTEAYNIPDPLVYFRRHEKQISEDKSEEQMDYAFRVSQSNLSKLGIHLCDDEIDRLRVWTKELPSSMSREDMKLCLNYFRILQRVQQSTPHHCPKSIHRIRSYLVRHLLSGVSLSNCIDFASSGLFACLLKNQPLFIFCEALNRLRILASKSSFQREQSHRA